MGIAVEITTNDQPQWQWVLVCTGRTTSEAEESYDDVDNGFNSGKECAMVYFGEVQVYKKSHVTLL